MRYRHAKSVLVVTAVVALAGCSASAATADSAATDGASTPAASATSPAAASPASTSPASSSPAAAAGGSGSFKAVCPSTATVAAATGESYPAPKQTNGGGELTCSYNNSNDVLVVGFTSYPTASGSDVKLAMDSQAKGQGVPDHAIPGLGTAAYGFTTKDGTTIIEMLVGSEIVVVTGISTSAAGVQTLARDIAG
jgi:hypothetical protein